MKLDNFVKDQKEMMVSLQMKIDEQEVIIKTAYNNQKKAFDSIFASLEERVKDWDKHEVIEYLRITNDDDNISSMEQNMVLTAFANTHHDKDGESVIQALKAKMVSDVVDSIADILFG